jgi:histidine triad (HIT) family protein
VGVTASDAGHCSGRHPRPIRGSVVAVPDTGVVATSCPFCRIVCGMDTATIRFEWLDAMAFVPLNPVTEGHVVVIPKLHVPDFRTDPLVSAMVMGRASRLATLTERSDLNVITSVGPAASQTVQHLHVHLVPRRPGDGLALPWAQAS